MVRAIYSPFMLKKPIKFSIAIIGAGPAGTALALLLAGQGLRVALADRENPQNLLRPDHDGRTTAISFGSAQILDQAGVWQKMLQDAAPILDIRVVDGKSRFMAHFSHDLAGDQPMGHIVENWRMRRALYDAAQGHKNISYFAPEKILSIEEAPDGLHINLESGKNISCGLLTGADGRKSFVREWAGIETKIHDYGQTAIIATLAHQKPHHGVAFECFRAQGPLAILPMTDRGGLHRSSLVWNQRSDLAETLMKIDAEDFCDLLLQRFGDYLGAFRLLSPRAAYPLNLTRSAKIYAPRIALVGDAARGIHPIAGQGLNLGLRDVLELSKQIEHHASLGLPAHDRAVLESYAKARKADTSGMIAATHGLNWLYGVTHPAVKLLRGIGLHAVEKSPALKKRFVKRAMGVR